MPADFARTDCCLDDDETVCALRDCYEDPWLDPGASGECTGYLVARLVLILCYLGIFLVCARYTWTRLHKHQVAHSNKDMVVYSLCCGALVRVLSFCGPMPLWLEETLRSMKDCCWTVSFALIVVFWVEMQKYVGVVQGVNRMKPTLFGTVALYVLMAVVRAAALSVCSAPSWLGSGSKYLVYFFNIVLFGFGVRYGSGVVSLASAKPRFAKSGACAVKKENQREVQMGLASGAGAGAVVSDVGEGAPAPSRTPECVQALQRKWETLLHSTEPHMKLVRFILAEFLLIVILFTVLIARNSAKPDEGESRTTYNSLKVTEKMLELLIFVVLCLTMTIESPQPGGGGGGGSRPYSSQTSRPPSSRQTASAPAPAAAAALAPAPAPASGQQDFSRTNPLVEAQERHGQA